MDQLRFAEQTDLPLTRSQAAKAVGKQLIEARRLGPQSQSGQPVGLCPEAVVGLRPESLTLVLRAVLEHVPTAAEEEEEAMQIHCDIEASRQAGLREGQARPTVPVVVPPPPFFPWPFGPPPPPLL